jgi:hypothetical protein
MLSPERAAQVGHLISKLIWRVPNTIQPAVPCPVCWHIEAPHELQRMILSALSEQKLQRSHFVRSFAWSKYSTSTGPPEVSFATSCVFRSHRPGTMPPSSGSLICNPRGNAICWIACHIHSLKGVNHLHTASPLTDIFVWFAQSGERLVSGAVCLWGRAVDKWISRLAGGVSRTSYRRPPLQVPLWIASEVKLYRD